MLEYTKLIMKPKKTFKYRCILIPGLCIFTVLMFTCGQILAQSDFDNDEDPLFEEDEIQVVTPPPVLEDKADAWNIFLQDATITAGYRFSHGTDEPEKIIDHHFFTRLEYGTLIDDRLYFKLDGKTTLHPKNDQLAGAKDKDIFLEGSVRELYIQPGFDNATITLGKQIRVWGKADASAITDVLSPRDYSQFIFVELEDARFGQWMVSADIYTEFFNTFVFASPYPGKDIEPDDNSRYHRPLPGQDNFHIQKDDLEFGDMEFGIKLDKSIAKTDMSLMAGRFFSNAPVFHHTGNFNNAMPVLDKTWPDYAMAGAAAAHAWKSWLFKLELAYKDGFPLQGINAHSFYVAPKKDLIDAAIALEYDANSLYRISLELSNRYILHGTSGLIPGTDENSSALYTTFFKDFFNQTLDFEYIFYHHIQEQNQFHQVKLTYDLTDNIQLKADYTIFNVKDAQSPMYSYKDEDRIGFEIRYFF